MHRNKYDRPQWICMAPHTNVEGLMSGSLVLRSIPDAVILSQKRVPVAWRFPCRNVFVHLCAIRRRTKEKTAQFKYLLRNYLIFPHSFP